MVFYCLRTTEWLTDNDSEEPYWPDLDPESASDDSLPELAEIF